MAKKLGIGVIGCGNISKAYFSQMCIRDSCLESAMNRAVSAVSSASAHYSIILPCDLPCCHASGGNGLSEFVRASEKYKAGFRPRVARPK